MMAYVCAAPNIIDSKVLFMHFLIRFPQKHSEDNIVPVNQSSGRWYDLLRVI